MRVASLHFLTAIKLLCLSSERLVLPLSQALQLCTANFSGVKWFLSELHPRASTNQIRSPVWLALAAGTFQQPVIQIGEDIQDKLQSHINCIKKSSMLFASALTAAMQPHHKVTNKQTYFQFCLGHKTGVRTCLKHSASRIHFLNSSKRRSRRLSWDSLVIH